MSAVAAQLARHIQLHSKAIFLSVILFVFPLLFIVILELTYTAVGDTIAASNQPGQIVLMPISDTGSQAPSQPQYTINGQVYKPAHTNTSTNIEEILQKRKQDAYLLLSLILLVLIMLAYWINRQTNWEQLYHKATRTSHKRSATADTIAHDFRAPLTAIKGYASFLQAAPNLSAEERRYADTITESAQRLVLMVNDFAELSRLQSGEVNLAISTYDTQETVRRACEAKPSDISTAKLTYVQLISQPLPLTTDHTLLQRIIADTVRTMSHILKVDELQLSCTASKQGISVRIQSSTPGNEKLLQQLADKLYVTTNPIDKVTLPMQITAERISLLHATASVTLTPDANLLVELQLPQLQPPAGAGA